VPDPRSPFDLPDQGDQPVVWDAQRREFVPRTPAVDAPVAAATAAAPVATPAAARQQWFVGSDAVGKAPPPRQAAAGGSARRVVVEAPVAPPAAAPVAAPPRPEPRPLPRPATPSPTAAARAPRRRRRRFLRRPKLRWVLAFLTLLPLLLAAFGWWFASSKFNSIERVPVSSVLTPTGGDGTNYLIVGSDSRDAVVSQGGTDPNVQPNEESPSGQRSDTMLLLRTSGDGALMMSIPRDLFVTLPDGSEGRINGAYNDGPSALIQTIQSNLQLPIHRYIEVDFVTFSGLVDALGGITLGADIIPCPAFDPRAGLNIPTAGPVELDGATALGFVRSRNYTEVCDGVERTDPTGDLGRVTRQQAFLRTVMAEAGNSRNPFTLMRIADSVSGGLRIDDDMGLIDAFRFAWNMGRLDPESVELPTFGFRTSSGAAVLGLVEDEAPEVLERFR
jgi:LCP family protein required for cell wall assembly